MCIQGLAYKLGLVVLNLAQHKLGNLFYRDRRQMESIFIVFHHGTMKVSKKSISKKLIIPEKSIITFN